MIDDRPYDTGATALLIVERGEVAMRDDRFTPSPEFSRRAPLTLEPSLTPEEQQLSAEFSLVQMLRCGATTIVDAGGWGPIWWLGNPPTDEDLLVDTVGRIGCLADLSLTHR